MQNFDARKQKRLGPAPIASFEKSFEDNTQTHPSTATAGITDLIATQNILTNRENMDSGKNLDNKSTSEINYNDQQKIIDDHNQREQQRLIHDATRCNPPDPPPLPHNTEPSVSDDISKRKINPLEKTTKTTPIKTTLKDGKKPPLLHSKDSIHDHPLRAPLQSLAPLTPRIDISRASSSSQHEDSRESSPENVFEQVGTGTLQEAISLGFREEGALDLRTSTEELYFMDPEQKREEQEKIQQAMKSPVIFKYDDQQLYLQQHQRKDSASSEVAALLCISGRTSRVSSVGSQGSAVSRLSAISAVSGVSRSPSPHRMLMETSFCGPKPLENVVESCTGSLAGPQTSEILENVLLSRTKDLTQVVLAEGIKIESSPKKKNVTNQENIKKKIPAFDEISKLDEDIVNTKKVLNNKKILQRKGPLADRKDKTKKIVGVTPTGTEYIRINLKPDHLYSDLGVAANEKIIDITGNNSADKPSTLQLNSDSEKPKPYSSPKQSRHTILPKDIKPNESRSPSPANPGASRKSSFCSLFKTKDSPDSPRDRSRSKSHERTTANSQTGTPNKQKSVLAIFKPKRSGSKSKSSSPIDQEAMSNLDGISQVEFKFNSETQSGNSQDISRLGGRKRYYDTPSDGTAIHIPLHTPPEEKDVKQMLPSITQEAIIKQRGQLRPMSAPTTNTTSAATVAETTVSSSTNMTTTCSVESIDVNSKNVIAVVEHNQPSTNVKVKQIDSTRKIENLDAIHTLPNDANEGQRTWSLEVYRHSSQESQDTVASENSANSVRRISKPNLDNVLESPILENGITQDEFQAESPIKQTTATVTVQQSQQNRQTLQESKPQQPSTVQTQSNGDAISKEKKRILFATRLGSGSQEQIFSTQFSLSKTESLSSQLSEQNSIPESPAETKESLHRTDTVIRRPDDIKKKDSIEDFKNDAANKNSSIKRDTSTEENVRSTKHTDEIEKRQVVVMRRRESNNEFRRRTDDDDSRHSKYFENLDVTKSLQLEEKLEKDNQKICKTKDFEISQDSKTEETRISQTTEPPLPTPHIPPPPPIVSDRQSVISTDEPVDTSESERDTETDPNCLKKHLPRHVGVIDDHESTGLVSQLSFDDELPYVPTTLPEERSHGISIIPVKERANMEVKTFSLDRPRSTTPMNPAHLEEFCEIVTPDSECGHGPIRGEKLRISLPRKNSTTKDRPQKLKSPRRISNASGKSWFEFAEQGLRGGGTTTTSSTSTSITTPKDTTNSSTDKKNCYDFIKSFKDEINPSSPPPPLPPRKPSTTSIASGQWVNFENIPEKRKPPKRITALPKETVESLNKISNIQYNYVKPEECQCECHDSERDPSSHQATEPTTPKDNSISSVDLLKHSSGEDLQPLLDTDVHDSVYRSDSSQDDYGIEERQQRVNQRRKNVKPSSNGNRSSGYSDCNESDGRQTDSSRRSKNSS